MLHPYPDLWRQHAQHAVTAIGLGYTAAYDASGNMLCRAPTSSATCSGTQTGAQLSYDTEGRLVGWQNAPGNPTSTEAMAYDGEETGWPSRSTAALPPPACATSKRLRAAR